jgi:hypothetical protein
MADTPLFGFKVPSLMSVLGSPGRPKAQLPEPSKPSEVPEHVITDPDVEQSARTGPIEKKNTAENAIAAAWKVSP